MKPKKTLRDFVIGREYIGVRFKDHEGRPYNVIEAPLNIDNSTRPHMEIKYSDSKDSLVVPLFDHLEDIRG